MAHFIVKCRCGNVLSQCRCPGNKTLTLLNNCPECHGEAKPGQIFIRHTVKRLIVDVELIAAADAVAATNATTRLERLGWYTDDSKTVEAVRHVFGPFASLEEARKSPDAWTEDV